MKEINTIQQWEDLLESSNEKPVILFKHSNACSTSAAAFTRMSEGGITEPIYMVVVQTTRDVSNKIAEDLEVKHESPQLIIVKNGRAVYNISHNGIDPQEIIQYIN